MDKSIKRKPSYKRDNINIARHKAQCRICAHPQVKEIELDYTHCIPFSTIQKRYGGIEDLTIMNHAHAFGLDTKRDRKNFYWRMIENVSFEKMTVENALEAAKQLDRIEHKVDIQQLPSNIQVVYSFGRPIGNTAGPVDDRLLAATPEEEGKKIEL